MEYLLILCLEAQLDVPLYWHHWKRQSKQLDVLTETIVESAKTDIEIILDLSF